VFIVIKLWICRSQYMTTTPLTLRYQAIECLWR